VCGHIKAVQIFETIFRQLRRVFEGSAHRHGKKRNKKWQKIDWKDGAAVMCPHTPIAQNQYQLFLL